MVRRSCKRPIRVTPHSASQALHALHYAQHSDNLRIEIAAARVLDAYCQGRLIAAEDVADTTDFLVAAERAGGMKYDITSLEHGFRVSVVSEVSDEEWPVAMISAGARILPASCPTRWSGTATLKQRGGGRWPGL